MTPRRLWVTAEFTAAHPALSDILTLSLRPGRGGWKLSVTCLCFCFYWSVSATKLYIVYTAFSKVFELQPLEFEDKDDFLRRAQGAAESTKTKHMLVIGTTAQKRQLRPVLGRIPVYDSRDFMTANKFLTIVKSMGLNQAGI